MSSEVKEKIIRDAVHGYIHIDIDYFKIIDTPNFQRLKRLEQTNTRPLYPCAHHDRFVHSLGVYHLGKIAFKFIKENSEDTLTQYRDYWKDTKTSFELACLLHDVGHAPFSHTFEYGFTGDKDENNTSLIDNILSDSNVNELKIKGQRRGQDKQLFVQDYKKNAKMQAPHEKVSAILVLTEYYDTIISTFKQDPFLIARMILGLKYDETDTDNTKEEHLFYNCFIDLLNGKTIDVDKLDYLARDQWATGHISKLIDYERLFSSMYIKEGGGKYHICYHKRCINELLGLIETKKMLTVNMHSHHIVKYDEYILKHAIEDIAEKIDKEEGVPMGTTLNKIFSLNSLNKDQSISIKGLKFNLITDDDLIHLLKRYIDEQGYAQEWFYRNYKLKAVWKTYSDYKYFFKDLSETEREILAREKETIVREFLSQNCDVNSTYYVETRLDPEYSPNFSIDIKVYIKEQIVDLESIRKSYDLTREESENKEKNRYFLLYLPKEIIDNKRTEFVNYVIQRTKEFAAEDTLEMPE